MKNCDFIVKRDDIYVGIVSDTEKEKIEIFADGIYDFGLTDAFYMYHNFDNRKYLLEDKPQLCYGNGSRYEVNNFRSMLFVLDENNCADDLLYNSPHYPIFNISENDLCLSSLLSIKHDAYNLGRLLQYFNYPMYLNYKDIVEIKLRFFGEFLLENSRIFGVYETDSDQTCVETYDCKGKHRTFNQWERNGSLPSCYFIALYNTRSKFDCNIGKVRDAFIPDSREGLIKSLKIV